MKNILLFLFYTSFHICLAQDAIVVDNVAVNSQIVIKVPFGKLTQVGEISFRIDKVIDSRCPSDVQCVWAGEIIASVSVFEKGIFQQKRDIRVDSVLNAENRLFEDINQCLYMVSASPYPKV